MTTMAYPGTICLSCCHLDRSSFSDREPKCTAYPSGIPREIVYGEEDHRDLRGDETKRVVHEVQPGYEDMYQAWAESREEVRDGE